MPIIINEPIIPTIPMDSFVVYKNAEPMKIDADRILPESKMLDFLDT